MSNLVIVEENGVRGVRVIVQAVAFFQDRRVRPLDAVFIPVALLKDNTLPSWAVADSPMAKAEVLKAKADADQKMRAAAITSSSSGHRGGRRRDSFNAVLAGTAPPTREGLAAIQSSGTAGNKAKKAAIKVAQESNTAGDLPTIPEDE